jgi:hypothetical protein
MPSFKNILLHEKIQTIPKNPPLKVAFPTIFLSFRNSLTLLAVLINWRISQKNITHKGYYS